MIDKAGNIGSGYSIQSGEGRTKFKPKHPGSDDVKQSSRDTYTHTQENSERCLIIPSVELKEKQGGRSIFKAAEAEIKKMDVRIDEKLPLLRGYVAELDSSKKDKLAEAGYIIVSDKPRKFLPGNPYQKVPVETEKLNTSVKTEESHEIKERAKLEGPRFDTPLCRQYDGKGITIAVIDTGIHPHPDFNTPDNRIVAFVDFVKGIKVPYDDDGHGTHVAGDAAGNGTLSEGVYQGSAPAANIAALKVLGKNGEGTTSDIIKAITWCIKNKKKHNIRVINMSLGDTAREDYWNDPINQAVQRAYQAGIVVCAAAGNEGPGPRTVGTPGDSPYAISVGAVDDRNTPDKSDDFITEFSSRGPTPGGLIKPDIVAPGEAIIAPMAPNTASETDSRECTRLMETLKWMSSLPDKALGNIPAETLKSLDFSAETIERWQKSPAHARKEIQRIYKNMESSLIYDDAYLAMPGTSMATPIVSGVVAKMLHANPDLTPGQVAEILKKSADKLPGDVPREDQGHGMIDPEEAIQMSLNVKEGTLEVKVPEMKKP